MYALIKFKCDGVISVRDCSEIKVVIKEGGVKTFEPFQPTDVTDFMGSRMKKYVLFVHRHGIDKRWYIMIGRLGACPKKLMKKASEVVWPDQVPKAVVVTKCAATSANEPSIIDSEVLELSVTRSSGEKHSLTLVKLAAIEEAVSLQERAIKALAQRVDECEKVLPNLDNIFGNAVTDLSKMMADELSKLKEELLLKLSASAANCGKEAMLNSIEEAISLQEKAIQALAQRVGESEKVLPNLNNLFGTVLIDMSKTLVDEISKLKASHTELVALTEKNHQLFSNLQIQKDGKMINVLEWVNKIPNDLSSIKATSEVNQTATGEVAVKKVPQTFSVADDSVENLSVSSWERKFTLNGANSTGSSDSDGTQMGHPSQLK